MEEPAAFFTTATGNPWHRSEAFRTVQRLAGQAGIDGQISPHSLRHAFATIALDTGVPLHALQDSMGDADPRTTRVYDRARNNLQTAIAKEGGLGEKPVQWLENPSEAVDRL